MCLLYGMPTWNFVLSAWSKRLKVSTIVIFLECNAFSFLYVNFSTLLEIKEREREEEREQLNHKDIASYVLELFGNLTFVLVILFSGGMGEGGI